MNLKKLMLTVAAGGAALLLVWLGMRLFAPEAPPTAAPEPEVARAPVQATLTTQQGEIEVTPTGGSPRPAHVPDGLRDGDIVTTSAQGAGDVVFAGNNVVHLGPSTSLVIGSHGAQTAELGAVLLAGSAKVASGEKKMGFKIGTPVGVVQMPEDKLASVNIQFDQGVKVLTGDVQVIPPESAVGTVMLSGQELTLEGVKVVTGVDRVNGLTLDVPEAPIPPLQTSAERRRGRLRLRATGQPRSRSVRRAALRVGDGVQVSRGGAATVALGTSMRLEMGSRGRFDLLESRDAPDGEHATGRLARGEAEIAIDAGSPNRVTQLAVGDSALQVRPSDLQASVDVSPQGDTAFVYVRHGVAMVGNTTIEAGHTAALRNNALVGAPAQVYPQAIAVEPNATTTIYYDQFTPPVRFKLPRPPRGNAEGARHFQVAADTEFTRLITAEAITTDSFAQDRIPSGTSYFRTVDAPEHTGRIIVAREPEAPCTTCRPVNVLDDTGNQVVLRYETNPPEVRLRWPQTHGAQTYTVQIFDPNDLTTPISSQETETTTVPFPDQLTAGGTYYWYVTAQRGAEVLSKGAVNTVRLEQERHTDGLRISTPPRGHSTRSRRLVTRGRVEPGARLEINGRAVRVRDGAFSLPVKLRAGQNRVVYHLRTAGDVDRFYVRDIVVNAQ